MGMSPSRLWQRSKKVQARQLITEIYDWFTEGFDTKDLQEAKSASNSRGLCSERSVLHLQTGVPATEGGG
jgi:hypothetical protein